MKRSLRKTAAHVHITYGGTFTNSLFGDNFTLETKADTLALAIDLSRNLRTRNKSTNSYIDAVDLAARHGELESIQIDERAVLDPLKAALVYATLQNSRRPDLLLSLSFGDRGTFSYAVEIQLLPGGGAHLAVRR